MKPKKLFLPVFFIALALTVTACVDGSGGAAATPTAGRYVEADVTPPISGPFISLLTYEGNLVVFNNGLRTRFDSSDGGANWVQSQGPGYNSLRFANVNVASFLPDGNLLAFMPGEGLVIVSPDGSESRFHVEEVDNGAIVTMIQVLEGGRVLLSYMAAGLPFGGGMINFDAISDIIGGGAIEVRGAIGAFGDAIGGNIDDMINQGRAFVTETFVVEGPGGAMRGQGGQGFQGIQMGQGFMGMGGRTSSIHDLATGRLIEVVPTPSAVSATGSGDFHIFTGQLILRHDSEGNVDTLLDGTAFAFGAQGVHVASIHALNDGSLAVHVAEGRENRLYRIYWDAYATINPAKVITIWSLEYNAAVRAAISELWRMNPDAYITYEIALTDGSAMSASDAIRTLNTRLLSREGPDVLILDGTPIENYANRGMLLDLTGRVSVEGMYQNLLAPFVSPNGQINVVPTQFSIPVLMGNAVALSEIQTLDALVNRVVSGNPSVAVTGQRGRGLLMGIPEEERAELHFNSVNELFNLMWQTNANAFINNNQLDSEALRVFFEAMEAISVMYNLPLAPQPQGRMMAFARGGAMFMPGSLTQYMMRTTNFAAFSIENLMLLHATLEREDGLDLAAFPGLTPGAWVPSTIVGVSADTNVPDFAIEFVNTLLSVQVQGINHGEGLPITHAGMAEQINTINEMLALMEMSFTIDINSLIGQLQTPSIIETVLQEIVWESVERLHSGRVDVEGAVREIEQRTRNYLAERS